jgi:23S rRNA (cytosine1962-C5)-methyltransferase
MPNDGYALLDCGAGRRLEAFGDLVVDRPAPGAQDPPRQPDRWAGAAIYHPASGWWTAGGAPLEGAVEDIRIAGITMQVRPVASGQMGVFPEHAVNAAWIADAVRSRHGAAADGIVTEAGTSATTAPDPPEILNLFAYTGLATLVASGAGARVVHVDASRPAVGWARRNAELSGLADRPIRWIVDDAVAFVRREARRGRRYAGLILDPPSYGHGGRAGRPPWIFDERVVELLDDCAGVAEPNAFWLLTTHSSGWDPARLSATLGSATDAAPGQVTGAPLELVAESGAVLRLGAAARFDPLEDDRR